MNIPSRLPLVRAIEELGFDHPAVECVAKLIGDAMSDAYRDAEEIAIAHGIAYIAAEIERRRKDMTGERADTRETAQ